MRKWEYKSVTSCYLNGTGNLSELAESLEQQLNDYGRQGWELIHIAGLHNHYAKSPILVFKRPLAGTVQEAGE